MKSDLTCPVEVVSVRIGRQDEPKGQNTKENGSQEKGQIVCVIEFFNLSEKVIDSLQMNILCFAEDGSRIGGRLVRASARGEARARFSGAFLPEHVEETARVEASVEKVWFQDGVVWRREERNVREYTSNALPQGRELDRLRAVAGQDAAGYAREDDIVWMCVCGRANRTSDDRCMRCQRERAQVLENYSFSAIDSTVGRKERQLEKQTRDTLRRSSEETERQMAEANEKLRRRRRRVTALIALLSLVAVALAAARWGVPYGASLYAGRELAGGKAASAKEIFLWVDSHWPGFMDADKRAEEAEGIIIEGLIQVGTDESLAEAALRASALGGAEALYERAVLARARLQETLGALEEAEGLYASLPESETARKALLALIYRIADEAQERLDYPAAIERFASLGEYEDAAGRREECIYLYGRQLMREGHYAQACEQFLQVTNQPDAIALIRQCRYAQALKEEEAGELEEAAALYESLGVYEQAETKARACRYALGMAALGEGDLERAAQQLLLAESYEDAAERRQDVVLTLGARAFEAGDYEEAIRWYSQLEEQEEPLLERAQYAFARELEEAGKAEEAAQLYMLLEGYEDAGTRWRSIEYALAVEEMDRSAESALERFEDLGDYEDAQERAKECRYRLAAERYAAGEYAQALSLYEQLGSYQESESLAQSSRYALAAQLSQQERYDEAALLYAECGAYLDAEDRAMRARYDNAAQLEAQGKFEEAARAFGELGSYEDAKARTERSEDLWLSATYAAAQMDMEVGDYPSVIDALEPLWQKELPERYAELSGMYVSACLSRAQELIELGRPFDALPFLERVPEAAERQLGAYVYQIIGRWKDSRGTEYNFRRDGSCSIAGEELYYGGRNYDIAVGSEPYPTKAVYSFVSLRRQTLTLKESGGDQTIRLTYVGEPTPRAESVPEEDGLEAGEDEEA